MKSNWDLCSYKVSLPFYHASESMNRESRKVVMERQCFWLSGAPGKHFWVISHLNLLTQTQRWAQQLSRLWSKVLWGLKSWLPHMICSLSKLWLNYISILLHGNLYLKAFISPLATRIPQKKLRHKTSQMNMQIPTGCITEAWIKTVLKTKTEHRYSGPDQKNGIYTKFRHWSWKWYSLLLSPALSITGFRNLVFCSCASQKHQSWQPTCYAAYKTQEPALGKGTHKLPLYPLKQNYAPSCSLAPWIVKSSM